MSLFGILSLGSQALLTGKRSIDITSENISNQYSDDYSRQLIHQEDLVPAGVNIVNIERAFDNSLFSRIVSVKQQVSYGQTYSDILSEVEALFNDIHGSGFSEKITEFFNAFNDVAINPDDISARDKVISVANQLVGRIRDAYDNLVSIKNETELAVKDNVQRINDILTALAKTNKNIKAFSEDKTRLNNYLNQRDRLLRDLSEILDVKVKLKSDNTVDAVSVKGHPLVIYDKASTLTTEEENGELKVLINGAKLTDFFQYGKIGAQLQAIKFINQKLDDLNDFTSVFSASVNKIHRNGYDLNGNTGINFFKISADSSKTYIDASNIDLNITDPKQIAAAASNNYLNSDNTVIKGIIALKDFNENTIKQSNTAVASTNTFGGGSFDIYLNNQKITTINYSIADTITDMANAINSSQDLVVANVYEYPNGSGNYYLELYAKDISKSGSIELKNDTGSFVAIIGGISDKNGIFNNAEETALTTGTLTIGGINYSVLNTDNYNLVKNKSFSELYNKRFIVDIGFKIETTKDNLENNTTFLNSLEDKLSQISSVNLDEELANMLKYQRAYQSAAKIISITDELLQTILGLVK